MRVQTLPHHCYLRTTDHGPASDVCHAEGQVPIQFGHDAIEVPGSRALLSSLEDAGVPWAIVTSGTTPLVQGWINVMKLAQPKHLVTAEQVARGKPDPACYRLGAQRLGFGGEGLGHGHGKQILVLEDAPSGIRAGKAAGYKVVALATTHAIDKLREAGADWIVRDLRSLRMVAWDAKAAEVTIEISDALRS